MAHIYMSFDFGTDEEKAQQARHKLEMWKQAFRLDKKMLYKFERTAADGAETNEGSKEVEKKEAPPKAAKSSKTAKSRKSGNRKSSYAWRKHKHLRLALPRTSESPKSVSKKFCRKNCSAPRHRKPCDRGSWDLPKPTRFSNRWRREFLSSQSRILLGNFQP
jgi:hypothetical protein